MDTILASLIVLQHQIRTAHWEITGPNFYSLHTLLGIQYEEISKFIDRVAEFMRSQGYHTISLSEVIRISHIRETVSIISKPWETIVAVISNTFTIMARMVQETDYTGSSPVLTGESMPSIRSWNNITDDLHEFLTKQAWLLRSHLSH